MNNNYGYMPALQIHDGYTTGGQYADQAKLNGRELSNSEKLDRLNPFSESGYMNEEDYRRRYNPDGTLRSTGQRPEGVLDGAMQSAQGVLNNMGNLTGMPAYLSGGSGVNGQPNAAAQPPAQPNTHEMPDGTVMEGATHEEYAKNQASGQKQTPVLSTPEEIPNVGALGQGDLARGMLGMDDEGSLDRIIENIGNDGQSGTATNNKRTETETAQDMERKKEERKEKMMAFAEMMGRYGGNIMNAGSRGGMAMVGAMGTTTAQIADQERKMEQQQFDNDLARDKERNRIGTAQQTDLLKKENAMVQRNARIDSLDTLIDDLTAAGDNVTGVWDGTVSNLFDRATGAPEANLRLRLEEQRVDAALTKVEKTKGAISNREMDLFLSPMPKLTDSEEVWIDWMTMQRNIAAKMSNIASGGMGSDGRYVNAVSEDAELDSLLANYAKKYPPN